MSEYDNSAVSDVSSVEDISPGDDVFPFVDPSPFPEAADSTVSQIVEDPRADEEPNSEITSDVPTLIERGELQIIVISPDGTMTIYDEAGNITAEVADNAYSLWLSENGALDKPFKNYSVTEALLLIVALGSLVGLISKIFKRRKL